MLTPGVFGVRRVVGMGRVSVRVSVMITLIMRVIFVGLGARRRIQRRRRCFDRDRIGRTGLVIRRLRLARVSMVVLIMRMVVIMIMRMTFVVMMLRIGVVMLGVVGVEMSFLAMGVIMGKIMRLMSMFMRLLGQGMIRACALDHLAADAAAVAAAARIAVARTAAVAGTVFAFLFGLAVGAFVGFDQRLPVGDRNLIIIRMDFAEGQKAVTVAAIFDEGRLQRRFYPRDLGEIDVAPQLFALGSLEIKLFDAIAADHNDPGLFRVGSIDQHFVGHFGTLDGGGGVPPEARIPRPGD